jgi:hypothetical protein
MAQMIGIWCNRVPKERHLNLQQISGLEASFKLYRFVYTPKNKVDAAFPQNAKRMNFHTKLCCEPV